MAQLTKEFEFRAKDLAGFIIDRAKKLELSVGELLGGLDLVIHQIAYNAPDAESRAYVRRIVAVILRQLD
jgi:hypothetical protein